MKKRNILNTTQSGFTLIEVLVALLVMSIGLLGLAALQATSLKTNHGAFTRGQAVLIAYDMMDRMRANQVQAIGGAYNRNFGDGIPAASGVLSDDDMNDWMTNYVTNLLPAGQASINCDGVGLCNIQLQWDESRIGGSATTGGLTNFSFTSQI